MAPRVKRPSAFRPPRTDVKHLDLYRPDLTSGEDRCLALRPPVIDLRKSVVWITPYSLMLLSLDFKTPIASSPDPLCIGIGLLGLYRS